MGLVDEAAGLAKTAVALARAEGLKDILAVLIELQIKTLDMTAEIRELRLETANLTEALKFKEAAVFRHNSYWTGPEDTIANGPYCSGCLNDKQKAIRLHPIGDGKARCPVCEVVIHGLPDSFSPKSVWATVRR
jgi:hypothetical protein